MIKHSLKRRIIPGSHLFLQPLLVKPLGVFLIAFLAATSSLVSLSLAKGKSPSQALYERMIDGLDGRPHSLKDWQGKVIIANFWASWCGPCQYEIPRFIKWQKQFADRGLQVVGIGLDDAKKLKNVKRSLDIDYPLLVMSLDKGRPILDKLGNREMIIPYTIIFDKDGSVAYRHKGLISQDEFDIMIAPLL